MVWALCRCASQAATPCVGQHRVGRAQHCPGASDIFVERMNEVTNDGSKHNERPGGSGLRFPSPTLSEPEPGWRLRGVPGRGHRAAPRPRAGAEREAPPYGQLRSHLLRGRHRSSVCLQPGPASGRSSAPLPGARRCQWGKRRAPGARGGTGAGGGGRGAGQPRLCFPAPRPTPPGPHPAAPSRPL